MAAEEKNRKKTGEAPVNTAKVENKFSKEQLLSTRHFRDRRDLLDVLLLPGEQYTVKEAERKMEDFMKGKVK